MTTTVTRSGQAAVESQSTARVTRTGHGMVNLMQKQPPRLPRFAATSEKDVVGLHGHRLQWTTGGLRLDLQTMVRLKHQPLRLLLLGCWNLSCLKLEVLEGLVRDPTLGKRFMFSMGTILSGGNETVRSTLRCVALMIVFGRI
jgi:hypothetical protein